MEPEIKPDEVVIPAPTAPMPVFSPEYRVWLTTVNGKTHGSLVCMYGDRIQFQTPDYRGSNAKAKAVNQIIAMLKAELEK